MEYSEIENELEDVLQNLESAIVCVDRTSDDLTDLEVMDALDYLIRAYTAEGNGFSAPFVRLSPLKREVVDAVKNIAEWRMGRTGDASSSGALQASVSKTFLASPSEALVESGSEALSLEDVTPIPVTLDEIVACLKRIRRSVKTWNGSNGRRGYLGYVRKFIP